MENISDSKLLPYGMMNFAVIRRDDYYYVDKTAFIPLIERSDRQGQVRCTLWRFVYRAASHQRPE